MEYLKKLGKSLLYTIIPLLITMLILTILNYFNIINYNVFNILKYITIIITLLIGSYKLGSTTKDKGYISGIKFALIIIIFILLFNYFIFKEFSIKTIIYYSIILTTSIVGSITGKNRVAK